MASEIVSSKREWGIVYTVPRERRVRRFLGAALLRPCGVVLLLFLQTSLLATRADFQAEKSEIEKKIASFGDRVFAPPVDIEKATTFVYLVYRHAALTGDVDELRRVRPIIAKAFEVVGPSEDLFLLRATLDLKLHQTVEARRDLSMAPDLKNDASVWALQGDLAVQEGRSDDAAAAFNTALKKARTWDNLCRLASWECERGEFEQSDSLYAEAEDELTAKEMRSYAWVEVQRGWLSFRRGRFEVALQHYNRADKAYGGYWLVHDHLAELKAALGEFAAAVDLYKLTLAEANRPEIEQELGELYLFMGKPEEAKPWLDRALSGYLGSAKVGEVVYFHHLAGFYADILQDGEEAVKWAQRDAAERHSPAANDTLAWALYRAGKFTLAAPSIESALASGTKEPHILFHAAMISLATEQAANGQRYMHQLADVNPLFATTFHVHR